MMERDLKIGEYGCGSLSSWLCCYICLSGGDASSICSSLETNEFIGLIYFSGLASVAIINTVSKTNMTMEELVSSHRNSMSELEKNWRMLLSSFLLLAYYQLAFLYNVEPSTHV